MATKLYFHNAANAKSGTFPTSRQSTRSVTNLRSATGALTLRTMDATIGAAMASLMVTTAGTTAFRSDFMGYFCSLPLSGAQTVGGGNFTLNAADAENHLAANFWVNSPTVYVWRPSTGAVVGYLIDSASSAGGSEPDASLTPEVTHIAGIASSAVSAQDGDVIIVEVYSYHNQDSTISRTGTFYFDGTTENTTENAVVSNHASYIEFAETLVFRQTSAAMVAWNVIAAATKSTAWRVLTSATRQSAWRIVGAVARSSAWRIQSAAARSTAWRITTSSGASTSWRVLASTARSSAWRIKAAAARSTAWHVLASTARVTAWRVSSAMAAVTSWRVLAVTARPSAWRIGATAVRATAWRVLWRIQRKTGWHVGALILPAQIVPAASHARIVPAANHARIVRAR